MSPRRCALVCLLFPSLALAQDTDLATAEPVDDNEEYAATVSRSAPADDSADEAKRAQASAPADSSREEAARASAEAAPDSPDEEAARASAEASDVYDAEAAFAVEPSEDADAIDWGDDVTVDFSDGIVSDPVTTMPTDYATDRIIVAFSSCRVPSSLTVSGQRLRRVRELGTCNATYAVPSTLRAENAVIAARRQRGVSYAELDYNLTILGTPNDPDYGTQWDKHMLGMDVAWEFSEGDNVVVAVVDTGVGEGVDGLGYLLPGYDFVDNDSNAADPHGHGSHVAATINQSTNNGVGYAGMAPEAMILPVRVCGPTGSCSSSAVAAGINYAVTQGAEVINISLGGSFPSSAQQAAIQNARNNGVLVVVSAGNSAVGTVSYPGGFPESFAVGALDCTYGRAYYSSWGTNLDIMAPGGGGTSCPVYQDTPYGIHVGMSGTSMAAPHIAGLGALLMAAGATDDEAEEYIEWVAVDMGTAGYDTDYGWGRARAAESLSTYTTPWQWIGGGGSGYLYWWYLASDDHRVVGDFTGDGQDELLFLNSPWSHLYTWTGSNWQYLWGTGSDWIYWWNMADDDHYVAGDFDGDGDDDLFALNDPWAHLMEWNGSSFDFVWGTGSGAVHWWYMDDSDEYLAGDFDGDGADELLAIKDPWSHLMAWDGSSWSFQWGTGSGWIGWWDIDAADTYVVADFDGDGADELLAIKDPYVQLMDWNGSSFQYTWGTASGWLGLWNLASTDHFAAADFDGDGAAELFSANDPWAHRQSFTGSGWAWDWGQGAGLMELWYQDDADVYLAGEFALGDGNEDLVSIKAPWWHLMVGE